MAMAMASETKQMHYYDSKCFQYNHRQSLLPVEFVKDESPQSNNRKICHLPGCRSQMTQAGSSLLDSGPVMKASHKTSVAN